MRQRVQRLIDTGVMQVVAVTDPLSLGLRRMAMIGAAHRGRRRHHRRQGRGLDDVEYLVVTAGSFDILIEVVVEDDDGLLDLMSRIRTVPGVRSTESFIYLRLAKQTYAWGAH